MFFKVIHNLFEGSFVFISVLSVVYFACTNTLIYHMHPPSKIKDKSLYNIKCDEKTDVNTNEDMPVFEGLCYAVEYDNNDCVKEDDKEDDPYIIVYDMYKKYNHDDVLNVIKQKNVVLFSLIKLLDNDKYMWLQEAMSCDSLDIFLLLLKNNTFSISCLESILQISINDRKYVYTKLLLDYLRKQNLLVKLFNKNNNLIFELAYKGLNFLKLIEPEIINSNININMADSEGDTLLIWACKINKTRFIKYLIEVCKIDKDLKDSLGRKAEYYANLFQNHFVFKFFHPNKTYPSLNIEENFHTDDETLDDNNFT